MNVIAPHHEWLLDEMSEVVPLTNLTVAIALRSLIIDHGSEGSPARFADDTAVHRHCREPWAQA